MGRTAGSDAAKSAGKRTENGGSSGRKKGRRSVSDKRRKARASWVMVRRSRTSTTESLMTGLQQPLMEVGEASDEEKKKVSDRAASPKFPEKMERNLSRIASDGSMVLNVKGQFSATGVPGHHLASSSAMLDIDEDEFSSDDEESKNISIQDIDRAALLLLDAQAGRPAHAHRTDHAGLKIYRFVHSSSWSMVYSFCVALHILEAMFDRSTLADHGELPIAVHIVEWALELVYFVDIYLHSVLASEKFSWRSVDIWTLSRSVVLLLQVLDLFMYACTGLQGNFTRWSRWTRPFMLVFRLSSLRLVLFGVLNAVSQAFFYCIDYHSPRKAQGFVSDSF